MRLHRDRGEAAEIDDRELARDLTASALLEIRYLAATRRRQMAEAGRPPDDDLDHIWFLADLCHNLPGVAGPPAKRPSGRGKRMSRLDRAMADRPMSWTWNTAGEEGRAWILGRLDRAGHRWTPPPPLPMPRTGPPQLNVWQRAGMPTRWPIQPPFGHLPLPRKARVLKALNTDALCAIYEEAAELELLHDEAGRWLRAHAAPDSTHYLVPDPADYYWPEPKGGIRWWQCTALLRMSDGEQVTSRVAVLPETFTALPSNLSRRQQRRFVHRVKATERDIYLWSRDQESRRPTESTA